MSKEKRKSYINVVVAADKLVVIARRSDSHELIKKLKQYVDVVIVGETLCG